mmetsp:Transcript_7105/g.7765  ORF Transcript_7105/g.7765 Transcript_7105/m.7765 type:complete len:196 (-) Transcript_7105:2293-2880(-)|eukprot:gene5790-6230_t
MDPAPPPPAQLSPTEKAFKYSNLLATAVNYNDTEQFGESLRKFCTPDVNIKRRVSTHVPGTKSNPIHSQFLTLHSNPSSMMNNVALICTEYHGIEQFCGIFRDYNKIIPDGIMEVYDHRCSQQSAEYSIYVSSFRYSGTIMYFRSNTPFSSAVDYALVQLCLQGSFRPLNMVGTVAMHVSSSGYVHGLEFFVEYV